MKVKSLSRVRLLATPWTAAYQAPLSIGFSRQEYWTGVPLPSPIYTLVYDIYLSLSNVLHSVIGSRFIHLIRTDSDVLLFLAEKYSIVYMYHNFFIHSSVDGHLVASMF